MLYSLISENEKMLEDKFKIKPELSSYKTYNGEQWKEFLETKKKKDIEGIFLPRNLTANVLTDTEFFETNLNHEYFGHGVFCEHSLIGKEIVEKEKEIESLEKKILGVLPENKNINVKVDKNIAKEYKRKKNSLKEYANQNYDSYEGFAIWMEYFLAKENNNLKSFNKKISKVDENTKNLFDHFKNFVDSYGECVLLYSLKFPKYYNKEVLNDLLKKFYKEEHGNIEFAMSYGSKKPYSDIDLFIVSKNKSRTFQNKWLDIYEFNKKDFKEGLDLMDISITDPLFSGEMIIGGEEKIDKYKKYVNDLEINNKMINYNLARAEQQKEIALSYPKGSKEFKQGDKYHKTCNINAKELSNGNKMLTLRNILDKYGQI